MGKMIAVLKWIIKFFANLLLFGVIVLSVAYVAFNWPVSGRIQKAEMGVTFSNRYASDIGLDWKKTFTAILDELQVKKIRIPVYWDLVEKEEGKYDFSDVDWQLKEAEKRGAEVVLTIGQKVPRWPECFIPEWVKNDDSKRRIGVLKIIGATVERYKNNKAVKYWQVENEPFLAFGVCPKFEADFFDQEIALVRAKDSGRKIIVTDSGELSLWYPAAKRADIFGTTMYLDICSEKMGGKCFAYPIGENFFRIKRWVIEKFANQKNAVVIELQGEPWLSGWTTSQPLDEQLVAMNALRLKANVDFAKRADFSEIYLWGAEWWYWLKEKQNKPEIWQAAKEIFEKEKQPIDSDRFYILHNFLDMI